MTPAERIADDTWHKLKEARELTVRLGEETLTDLLILDMRRHAFQNIWVHQFTRLQEATSGTDLLVVVRDGRTTNARLYAIQSKKLCRSGHYEALKKANKLQLDNLEKYALAKGALPYYLFYNFVSEPQKYWHCNRSYDKSQLGCTLVPSRTVRAALDAPPRVRPRSFEYMHESRHALPWRCMFDCPHWERQLHDAWPKRRQGRGLDRRIPQYDLVTLDPVPGAWPVELTGDDEVDIAPIAGRYVDDRGMGSALDSQPGDVQLQDNIRVHLDSAGNRISRPAEFRPRRFIFVDKQT